jgi:hypothetical protein
MVAGNPVPAQRYQLSGPKIEIDLWYGADGRWLGLSSKAKGGRQIHYKLRQQS